MLCYDELDGVRKQNNFVIWARAYIILSRRVHIIDIIDTQTRN